VNAVARRRVLAAAAILTVIAVAGAVWLVRLAIGGDTTAASVDGPATSPAPASSTGEPPGTPTTAGPSTTVPTSDAVPSGTSSTPGRPGTTPPRTRTSSPVGSPPVPKKLIQVGGVTLDNASPRTQCAMFRTTLAVSVRVDLILLDSADQVRISSGQCDGVDAGQDFSAPIPCAGATLRGGSGCYVGFVPAPSQTESRDYHATVRLRLLVRCTSANGTPCDDEELVPPPGATHPVDVQWVDAGGRDLCYHIPASSDEGIFC
jgi:hypothetical protein